MHFREIPNNPEVPVTKTKTKLLKYEAATEAERQQQKQQHVLGRSFQTRHWKVPHYAKNPQQEFLTFTALVAGDDDITGDDNSSVQKKLKKNKICSSNNEKKTKKKELVVCWHGFPDTNHTFEPLLRHLTKTDDSSSSKEEQSSSNYIVIAPKLPGYQESSHLGRGQYTVLQLARQVIEFLRVILQEYYGENADRSLHLVGHDWGALICSAVCQLQPHMIASFTNLSMPNTRRLQECVIRFPRQLLYSWYIYFFQLPLVPQYVLLYRNCALVQKLWNDWSPPPMPRTTIPPTPTPLLRALPTLPVRTVASRPLPELVDIKSSSSSSLTYFLDLAKRQFLQEQGCNNNRSIVLLNALDYYRCNFRNVWLCRPMALTSHAFLLSGGKQQQQQQRETAAVPTLAIGGALDGCIMTNVFQASHHFHNSTSTNEQQDHFDQHLEVLVVENAGHFVHLEQPDIVNGRIAAFIKRFSARD
jgi:pimeloyl-ACP methyl ester carboxylesterase